jgi:hypothetical protein
MAGKRRATMAHPGFEALVGTWRGENILHNPMTGTPESSATTFHNQLILNASVLELTYDWVFEGQKQEGRLTMGGHKSKDDVFATWIDTWHMSSAFMGLKGTHRADGIDLAGEYEVEGHPNWGWTIAIQTTPQGLQVSMKNVSPEKQAYPAVDITLVRS